MYCQSWTRDIWDQIPFDMLHCFCIFPRYTPGFAYPVVRWWQLCVQNIQGFLNILRCTGVPNQTGNEVQGERIKPPLHMVFTTWNSLRESSYFPHSGNIYVAHHYSFPLNWQNDFVVTHILITDFIWLSGRIKSRGGEGIYVLGGNVKYESYTSLSLGPTSYLETFCFPRISPVFSFPSWVVFVGCLPFETGCIGVSQISPVFTLSRMQTDYLLARPLKSHSLSLMVR